MRVSDRQSTFDIAAQTAGSIEAAFSIALKNGISITDQLVPGQELILTDVVNKDFAIYYDEKNISPATAPTTSQIFGTQFSNEFK